MEVSMLYLLCMDKKKPSNLKYLSNLLLFYAFSSPDECIYRVSFGQRREEEEKKELSCGSWNLQNVRELFFKLLILNKKELRGETEY